MTLEEASLLAAEAVPESDPATWTLHPSFESSSKFIFTNAPVGEPSMDATTIVVDRISGEAKVVPFVAVLDEALTMTELDDSGRPVN